MPPVMIVQLCQRLSTLEERVANLQLWIKVVIGMNATTLAGVMVNLLKG